MRMAMTAVVAFWWPRRRHRGQLNVRPRRRAAMTTTTTTTTHQNGSLQWGPQWVPGDLCGRDFRPNNTSFLLLWFWCCCSWSNAVPAKRTMNNVFGPDQPRVVCVSECRVSRSDLHYVCVSHAMQCVMIVYGCVCARRPPGHMVDVCAHFRTVNN